ncbi:MAG: hypothetical protein LBU66_06355 [Treponema sp.]|jgi:tetratricopeptide (TPR) repeat protein|nr:hypothetical protein [Treponema sp.]
MFVFLGRLIYGLSNKIRRKPPDGIPDGKLVITFGKNKKSPFDIKSETSYNAYLSNVKLHGKSHENPYDGSLFLGLKKTNFIAWVDIPETEYKEHIIEAKIRLDSRGGYAASGVIFRIMNPDSYFLALVSSKGYFRLDAVKDGAPKALIAWTEISDFDGTNIHLEIITYGSYFIVLVNGNWLGEITDDSISSGKPGFVLASYETADNDDNIDDDFNHVDDENSALFVAKEYTCMAWLDYFSIDTRVKNIEDSYKKWTTDSNINAEFRLRLAETFAVMGKYDKALEQIKRAWKRRDEAITAALVSYTEVRTKRELLLAARMSFSIGQYVEAEEFIDSILSQWGDTPEGITAHTEKFKVLNELDKFAELKEFVSKYEELIEKDIEYYAILGRCYWELKEYAVSARNWIRAFRFDSGNKNGVYAVNAANALELAGNENEALSLFLEAGKIFLNDDNKRELAAMMPKLAHLGKKNWEARALAGKWAFSIEDYKLCEKEFFAAVELRKTIKPRPKDDPAVYYLWGLVKNINGKTKDAIRMLEKAVKLAPDYGLFRFKLAEIKLAMFKLTNSVHDENLAQEFHRAIELIDGDMSREMSTHAGNLFMSAGDKKTAKHFFDLANDFTSPR